MKNEYFFFLAGTRSPTSSFTLHCKKLKLICRPENSMKEKKLTTLSFFNSVMWGGYSAILRLKKKSTHYKIKPNNKHKKQPGFNTITFLREVHIKGNCFIF